MTNLWDFHPGIRRLILMVKQRFWPSAEAQFQKYDVASRPRAETLRRRLLLRSQVNGPENLPRTNCLTPPAPTPSRWTNH